MRWFKKNWDAIIAFLFIWIAPLAFLTVQGVSYYRFPDNSGKWVIEFVSVIILGIILIIYFKRIRKWLERKFFAKDIRGEAPSPVLVLINSVITIMSLVFGYLICVLMEAFSSKATTYLKIIMIFVAIGLIFNFVHSLRIFAYEKDGKE